MMARAADCTSRHVVRATVPQIAANPDSYQGQCVVVDGVMQGLHLYESVDGVYLQPRIFSNPASSGFQLGLDHLPSFSEKYRHVSIVGRVQDCETIREIAHANEKDDEIVMVMGYCHSNDGPYLWISELHKRSGPPFMRQLGFRDRQDYGDLEPAPADWPHRARVESLVAQFLKALRERNRDGLLDIHFRNVGLEWKDDELNMQQLLLDDPKSPFREIRDGTGVPQQLLLVERDRLRERQQATDDPEADYTAYACFCREPDCTGRWPIATFDADNLPQRPYACTVVSPYFLGKHSLPFFRTASRKYGLTEPATPGARHWID